MFVALIKLLMFALRPFWPVAVDDESRDDESMYEFCCCCCCCWAMFRGGVCTRFTFVRFTTSCAIVLSVDIDSLDGSDGLAWESAPDDSCFAAGPLNKCCCWCCWGDVRLVGDVRPLTAVDWLLVGDTQLLSELLLMLLFMWFSIDELLFDITLLLLLLLCTAVECCDWRSVNKGQKGQLRSVRREAARGTHLKLTINCCYLTTLEREQAHYFVHSTHLRSDHFRESLKIINLQLAFGDCITPRRHLKSLPGFCLATAENAIGAVGSIVDGDWMLLLFELFWARIWAADGWWFLLGVELINGLELIEEFCEAATEAADEMLLLMVFELLSDNTVDVEFRRELLISIFARTAVGFTTGYTWMGKNKNKERLANHPAN